METLAEMAELASIKPLSPRRQTHQNCSNPKCHSCAEEYGEIFCTDCGTMYSPEYWEWRPENKQKIKNLKKLGILH